MKRQSVLAVVVLVCVMSALGQADFHNYMLGDDDGFGNGSPVVPGMEIYNWGPADGDGTDEVIADLSEPRDFVFAYDTFSSITACYLFVQYFDWPETQVGFLWIDDHKTSFEFPQIPLDQEAPWTVLGVTIDLMPYVEYLYDGQAVFNFVSNPGDGYVVDYMKLSIDGDLSAVPLPGSVLLGVWAVGWMAHKLRRDRRLYM